MALGFSFSPGERHIPLCPGLLIPRIRFAGVDKDAATPSNETPLFVAALRNQAAVFGFACSAGASSVQPTGTGLRDE